MPGYQPSKFHFYIAQTLQAVARGDIKRLIIQAPPRHGKPIAHDTPILMATGAHASVDALHIGDMVIGSSGQPRPVTAVLPQGRLPILKLTSAHGRTIRTAPDHPFLTPTGWVKACDLAPGDTVAILVNPAITAATHMSPEKLTAIANHIAETGLLPLRVMLVDLLEQDADSIRTFLQAYSSTMMFTTGTTLCWSVHPRFVKLMRQLFARTGICVAQQDYGTPPAGGPDLALLATATPNDAFQVMLDWNLSTNHDLSRTWNYVSTRTQWLHPHLRPDTIIAIQEEEPDRCVCIEVAVDHSYVASEFVVHNSEITSVHFPPWYLANHPDHSIIACSYGQTLVNDFSYRAKNDLLHPAFASMFPDITLDPHAQNLHRWRINQHRGYYLASGVGGPITGSGANGLIIDDPIKQRADAMSESYREKQWTWYQAVAKRRLEPNAFVIIAMTRWHLDDLAGRLLALANQGGEQWHTITLPAIAGEADQLGRQPGEALWPERWPLEDLIGIRDDPGMIMEEWDSQYQQTPTPAGGAIFRHDFWRSYEMRLGMRFRRIVASWDTAFKSDDASAFSAVWTAALGEDGLIYVLDVQKIKATSAALIGSANMPGLIVQHYMWLKERGIAPDEVAIEDKASGTVAIQMLASIAPHLPIVPVPVSGKGKEERARAIVPFYEAHRVLHPTGALWRSWYEPMCEQFPVHPVKDPIDAMTQGIVRLVMPPRQYVQFLPMPRVSLGDY